MVLFTEMQDASVEILYSSVQVTLRSSCLTHFQSDQNIRF